MVVNITRRWDPSHTWAHNLIFRALQKARRVGTILISGDRMFHRAGTIAAGQPNPEHVHPARLDGMGKNNWEKTQPGILTHIKPSLLFHYSFSSVWRYFGSSLQTLLFKWCHVISNFSMFTLTLDCCYTNSKPRISEQNITVPIFHLCNCSFTPTVFFNQLISH